MAKKLDLIVKNPLEVNDRVKIDFPNPSLTDQSFKDECDIGFIISNFVRTGKMPDSTMNFADCTTAKDYQDAMYLVAEANSNFEQLPSKIRDEFKTVENYLSYISNPANLKDSYERGLIDRGSVDYYDVYPDPEQLVQQNVIVQEPQKPVETGVTDVSSSSSD